MTKQNIDWDVAQRGIDYFNNSIPLDKAPPPSPGESAVLTKDKINYQIIIEEADDASFTGNVSRIFPIGSEESSSVKIDQKVSFELKHIVALHRKFV